MRRTILLALVSSLLGAGAAFPLAAPAHGSSCASTAIYLADYSGTAFSPYYWAAEGSPIDFRIERHGHICTSATATATYATPPITASTPADYESEPERETVTLAAPVNHGDPTSVARSRPTIEDEEVEGLEQFLVDIESISGAGAGIPNEVPAVVIDDDGADRFSFGPGSVVGGESSPAISFPVIRLGPASTETIVELQVGAPTDSATRPADYTGTVSGTLTFAPGDRVKTVSLTVVNDDRAEPEEAITIALSGATIEGPATKTVTIQDNEEHVAPVSRWHHPRQGVEYPYGDYRLREIHVYADDNASLVSKVHFALRKKMTNGACRWWNGTGFSGGPCTQKKWIRMRVYDHDTSFDRGFYFYRLPKLASSVRTRIRNYRAYSRATDKAGNVETLFKVGRNANTFEVKRP